MVAHRYAVDYGHTVFHLYTVIYSNTILQHYVIFHIYTLQHDYTIVHWYSIIQPDSIIHAIAINDYYRVMHDFATTVCYTITHLDVIMDKDDSLNPDTVTNPFFDNHCRTIIHGIRIPFADTITLCYIVAQLDTVIYHYQYGFINSYMFAHSYTVHHTVKPFHLYAIINHNSIVQRHIFQHSDIFKQHCTIVHWYAINLLDSTMHIIAISDRYTLMHKFATAVCYAITHPHAIIGPHHLLNPDTITDVVVHNHCSTVLHDNRICVANTIT